VLARYHVPNDPRDPVGATFGFDMTLAQLEVLASQQIHTVREYSVDFGGLTAPPSVRNALRDIFKK
jgi:hypothetical protein